MRITPSIDRQTGPLVESYLQRCAFGALDGYVEQLQANANDSFRQGFELQVAGVPIAARHTRFIERSLECLAVQAERAPSTPALALSLNYPMDDYFRTRQQMTENVGIVKRFQDRHPHIPLSYFVTGHEEDTPISRVLDCIFASTTILHKQGAESRYQPLTNLLYTRWDVDTVDATPTYFASTQQAYLDRTGPVWMSAPPHTAPPS